MENKTILLAVTNDISTDNRVHKIASYLIDKNYSVFVYGRVLPNTIQVHRKYKIIRKKHWFNNDFWFYAEYNFRLFWFLIFTRFTTILANDLDTLPACFFASKIKNTKLVYDSHELFSEGPELQGRKFVQNFWRKLEDFFLPKIKFSYTVSSSISSFYKDKYNNNMGVVRNLPLLKRETREVKVKFPTKNKTILYQGVLNPGRGIKLAIMSLHYLDNVDLVIIGYGKVENELRQFTANEKLEKRVHFLGRVDNDILPNYTKIANIGIVLEEPFGLSFEYSLPNKLFDYIHSELPILAGNLPEIKNIIDKYKVGLTLQKYDPKEIASCIKSLLDDKVLILEIKENQKRAKKILNWENETKVLDTYF